ncbi:hypothetical protein [Longispora urticae]
MGPTVHTAHWQRALVAVAVANTVAASVYATVYLTHHATQVTWGAVWLIHAVLVVLTALPLLCRREASFQITSWSVAGVLALAQCPGLWMHLGWSFLGVPLLLLAATHWPRRLPVACRLALPLLMVAALASLWGPTTYSTFLDTRNAYIVTLPDGTPYLSYKSLLMGDGSGIGAGADNVFTGPGPGRIYVGFGDDSQAEVLRRHLLAVLPPGTRVERCHGSPCVEG